MRAALLAGALLLVAAAASAQPGLPPSGIAIQSGHAVRLYAMDGSLARTLAGYRFADGRSHEDGVVWLRDPRGRLLELSGGRLAHSRRRPPRDAAYSHGDCRLGARRGDTLIELCGAPHAPARDATVVRVRGTERVVLTHAVARVRGTSEGWWTSASLDPTGRTVLAQWSGECEIPAAFFVDAVHGGRTAIEGGREAEALGWWGGRAVVQLLPGACGRGAKVPGVYLYGEDGRGHLAVGTRGFVAARFWGSG